MTFLFEAKIGKRSIKHYSNKIYYYLGNTTVPFLIVFVRF